MRIWFWKDGGAENESNQVVILAINLRLRNRWRNWRLLKGSWTQDPVPGFRAWTEIYGMSSRSELCTLAKLSRFYTPTGNGLVCAGLDEALANLPCNSDINPVYQ